MVWQEDVGKMVMLTNIVELGKVDTKRAKVVKHFHFSAWPDMSVPDTAGPILDLLQCVRSRESHSRGPMVVHCSAGVGRTGTFITLDAMLDMAAAENRINVYEFVCQMRQNRMKMVQVAEQYEFIFDVLVEYFVIGVTSIQVEKFRPDFMKLRTINEETGKSYLQEEFEKLDLTSIIPAESNLRGGRNRDNLQKNRFPDCIPVDTYRPYLMTDVGDLGNNYINASFLNGYRKKNMFLGTQMPLENTVIDFWRMVWDYNSNFIVMLNDTNPQDEGHYWSDSGVLCRGPFAVKQLSCEDISNIRCSKLRITNSSQNKQSRTIQHIQCLNLPITATNYEISTTLVQVINSLRREEIEIEEGPITVHCV
ncbi:Receptor-type tyrosine-protein phosphatase mu [Holothuria leucospilota]|uniref:Receptor-type tyrosine-protein phosphatase mu n=1 Tax=Holothuria leucospilota TaxID=206669 RepID=A0A9Q1HBX8_HOLLE|nr:Receptor-type tyrosine-protein phosphatase mu [Holothuria leucospilota]